MVLRRPTRRELVSDGLAAAAGVIGAGAAASLLAPSASGAEPPAQAEARALIHTLQLEQLLVIAYRQVIDSNLLTASVAGQLRVQLSQELEHVSLLEHALTSRGEIVSAPPSLAEAQAALARHHVHWSLTRLRNQHDSLKLLVDVESLVENAYFKAVGHIQDPGLVQTCAAIMGCEAQHWTVISGYLNRRRPVKVVPYPFVEGTP
ncbi:MAG: ferritin-like domain-containing protein [Solirubrobacterales bacterium]|nr:ferritin-like domain-containing protein [Solirubrobacterales bacterium]